MARQRPKQLEPNRIGSSKLGFDGEEEDGWVFVKKQRVIIVLPSLPLPGPSFTVENPPPPATSHPLAELRRDSVVAAADNNNQETARVVVVPSLPPPDQFVSQRPETCRSLVELRDVIAADIHKTTTPAYTVVPSLPLPEPFVLQKPATSPVHTMLPYVPVPETSQTQAEFRYDKHEASLVHTVVPSFPGTEHIKPAASQSRGDLRAEEEKRRASLVHGGMPSLPVTEHTPLQKPATWRSQAEFRAKETPKAKLAHTMVVPSGPVNERVIALQKPTTSKSQAEETVKGTLASTVGPVLSATEHRGLQKPVASQSQAALRAKETLRATRVQAVPPSLPVLEYCTLQKKPATWQSQAQETRKAPLANTVVVSSLPVTLQKPATSQSQANSRAKETPKAPLANTVVVSSLPVTLQKPATSQSQANSRAKETPKATRVQAVVPPLPVLDYCTLQKPARDFVSDAQETADFQAVDKPERTMDRRKAPPPGPRRSLQEPERRLAIQRNRRTSHNKPVRFPRVMCSSVAMDNEKLRVVNLEKKVEKAGGLNEWVGSIGLGREFERMLRGQRMSKFQMANLTMEKLKQMGALAVGPRRKLIHAIRCVYHPHCLRASFN